VTPIWIDHLLVVCFAVLLPLRGATVGYRRVAALGGGVSDARVRFYRQSLVLHALVIVITLVSWRAAGREWSAIGLAVPDPGRLLAGIAAAFVAAAAHCWQGVVSQRDRSNHASQLQRLGRLDPLMPRTPLELDWFIVLLLVAAAGEEVLFRGFLTAYLASYLPWLAAVALSVVLFAFGHLYQGIKGIAQTLVIGALCMAFYVYTGSLWPAIVLHAGLNFVSALLGYAIVRAIPSRPASGADRRRP
jgi:membrane protease YdiL (CAAX protease family)